VKVLVLGAAGQVGRALVAAPPPRAQVVALDRRGCDIGDRGAVAAAVAAAKPDLVFNAAAYTAVDRAEAEPEAAALVNGAAPGWIAEACAQAGVRLVHLSTDFVFDGQSPRPYRAADPTAPLSVYGTSKRSGEAAVLAGAPDALIVRTSWVHSAAGANFVRTMLRLMRARGHVDVVADQIGTPTFAPSLADALWRLAAVGASGIHHFTDAGVASWYDFAVAIQEEAAAHGLLDAPAIVRPIASADFAALARRPACSLLDKSDTWGLLGGSAPHWRVNLRACLSDIRAGG